MHAPSFWQGAAFRFLAGVLLGFLCYLRCFALAVGSHALYDILLSVQKFLQYDL